MSRRGNRMCQSGLGVGGFEFALEHDPIRQDTTTRDAPFRSHCSRGRALYEALGTQAAGLREVRGVGYLDRKTRVVHTGPTPLRGREVVMNAGKGNRNP